METSGIGGNSCIGVRTAVIQLESEEEVKTRQEQKMQSTDKVVKSLSPLINSMRLFGLYFTRESPRVHPTTTSQLSCRQSLIGRCQSWKWNPTRVYATVMLVVIWLNFARYLTVFDGKEALGVDLFVKLGLTSNFLFILVLYTAYYIASHTGSLDQVLRQVNLTTADISLRCSLRAKVATLICWTALAINILFYIYPIFGQFNDKSLLLYTTFHVSKPFAYIVMATFIVLQVHVVASFLFPQAMNIIVFIIYTAYSGSLIILASSKLHRGLRDYSRVTFLKCTRHNSQFNYCQTLLDYNQSLDDKINVLN